MSKSLIVRLYVTVFNVVDVLHKRYFKKKKCGNSFLSNCQESPFFLQQVQLERRGTSLIYEGAF